MYIFNNNCQIVIKCEKSVSSFLFYPPPPHKGPLVTGPTTWLHLWMSMNGFICEEETNTFVARRIPQSSSERICEICSMIP